MWNHEGQHTVVLFEIARCVVQTRIQTFYFTVGPYPGIRRLKKDWTTHEIQPDISEGHD